MFGVSYRFCIIFLVHQVFGGYLSRCNILSFFRCLGVIIDAYSLIPQVSGVNYEAVFSLSPLVFRGYLSRCILSRSSGVHRIFIATVCSLAPQIFWGYLSTLIFRSSDVIYCRCIISLFSGVRGLFIAAVCHFFLQVFGGYSSPLLLLPSSALSPQYLTPAGRYSPWISGRRSEKRLQNGKC